VIPTSFRKQRWGFPFRCPRRYSSGCQNGKQSFHLTRREMGQRPPALLDSNPGLPGLAVGRTKAMFLRSVCLYLVPSPHSLVHESPISFCGFCEMDSFPPHPSGPPNRPGSSDTLVPPPCGRYGVCLFHLLPLRRLENTFHPRVYNYSIPLRPVLFCVGHRTPMATKLAAESVSLFF